VAESAPTIRVSYPSEVLPAPPRFSVDVPRGWTAHGAPSVLAMIRPAVPADGGGGPNLTINADLVPADADPMAVLQSLMRGVVRSAAGAEEVHAAQPAGSGSLRSAVGAIRIPGESAAVIQALTVLVVDAGLSGGVTYAFTIVCTWAENDRAARETLRDVQGSFTLVGSTDGR
jgi:hypothetical protein